MNRISGSLPYSIPLRSIEQMQTDLQLVQISLPDLIRMKTAEAGYSTNQQELFVRIAEKESTMNPDAKGYAGNYFGLFQIYEGTWNYNNCTGNIFNPSDNIDCAIKVQQRSGWTPWQVYTDGLVGN